MNKISKIILSLSLGWLGCFFLPSAALTASAPLVIAGKVGKASEVNEIQFLIDVFQVIMPIYIKNSYRQSDANMIDILKSGYQFCNTSPQEFKDYIESLPNQDDRIVIMTLQEIAPKYLCP